MENNKEGIIRVAAFIVIWLICFFVVYILIGFTLSEYNTEKWVSGYRGTLLIIGGIGGAGFSMAINFDNNK